MKKKLLWVGDAGCQTGFARGTHHILETVYPEYDVTVLGMNYRGDPPNPYPIMKDGVCVGSYPMYVASVGGDSFGVGRLLWMCDLLNKPDLIVIQNDGWNIPSYMHQLVRVAEYADIPVVAIVAVDGKNFDGEWLDGIAHAIFWTEFALKEARFGGYKGPATVIPLGIDPFFHPTDKQDARKAQFQEMYGFSKDAFIVGNVNRNQPRKRWDLMIKYFAYWLDEKSVNDAFLYLHTAPTGDTGVNVRKLAQYYGVFDRLLLREPAIWHGDTDEQVRNTYNCFDINATTTQGEGMGLTTMEAMACGIPCVGPNWSALGDWARDAMWLVRCSSTAIGPPYVNVVGGIPDQGEFIEALDTLYRNRKARETFTQLGLQRMSEPRFQWPNIGQRYLEVLAEVLAPAQVAVS